jgi:hypothetical protein
MSMKRVCYEVKTSRADFLCEMKHPLKRRIGLRYSNEFYFVTPSGLLDVSEIPVECGLIEIGAQAKRSGEDHRVFGPETFSHFAPEHEAYCRVVVPAPWRDTPGPTWQEQPPTPLTQQRLEFA